MDRFVAILLAGITVFLPFVGEQVDSGDYCTLAILIAGSIIALTICLCRRKVTIPVSRTDVALLLFIGYILIYDVFSSGLHLNRLFLYVFLSLLYIAVKTNRKLVEKYFPYGIIMAGITQSVMAYMQLADVIPSNHNAFPCTGSFLNPAPLGAVTALAIVTGVTLMVKKQGSKRYLMIPGIAFMLPVLFYADSRAAWLACTVTIALLPLNLLPVKRMWKILIFISCLGLSAIPLYNHKPTSADARLLIWNNCAAMIKEKPIIGHGTDAVKRNYMLYQAEYFANGGSDEEKLIVAHNNHAFNEALNVLCSYGLVGFILMTGMIAYFFIDSQRSSILPYSMGCILIFSMFSYPLEEITLLTIAVLILALTPNSIITISVSGKKRLLSVMAAGVVLIVFGYDWNSYRKFDKAVSNMYWDKKDADYASMNFSDIKNNPSIVARYGKTLYEGGFYREAIPILQQMARLRPSPDVYYDLGECYERHKMIADAERCYRLVADMLPAYITPQYKLLKLYQRTENAFQAEKTARYMLSMPLKKETAESGKMKSEAHNFLSTIKN